MAGQLKVGGNIIASHSGIEGAGEVTLQNVTLGDSAVPSRSMNFRNRIINGNLSNPINQRGAGSITSPSSGSTGYTYDRWYFDGSTYLYQGIEDKNVNNGTYVISWVGDNLIAHWALEDDNDTTPPYTAGPDSALTWNLVFKNSTFTINESSEYGKHLWIRFSLDTGGDFADLDKVQVEEGTVPTPFEHRPYGVELALCQRYFYKATAQSTWGNSSSYAMAFFYHPVEMRSSPTRTPISNSLGTLLGGELNSLMASQQISGVGTQNASTIVESFSAEL